MKRLSFLLIIIFTVMGFHSCKKNERASFVQEEYSVEVEQAALAGGLQLGYVLRVNGSFNLINENTGAETDRTTWSASMALGERVYTGETRRATFPSDGRVYDFIEVRRNNGSDGYAFAAQVAVGGSLAVVTDERALLHRSPQAIDVSGIIVSRKTVVVYYPETQDGGYVEIRAYDPERQAYISPANAFVRFSSLSTRDSDIQSSILMQTALPLKNEGQDKVRRDALLESALYGFPDSVFSAEIQELLNPNTVSRVTIDSFSIRDYDNIVQAIVTADNVNVRDLPDVDNGRVVGRVNDGDLVTINGHTTTEVTIGGFTDSWYRIISPYEGWVFGAYLED